MKKLLTIFLCAMMTISMYAQNAKSTGITDIDVQNLAKNYQVIAEEIEEQLGNMDNPNYVMKKADYVKAQKILSKYGFSGTNSVEKYAAINQCIGIIQLEKSGILDSYKSMGIEPLAEMKKHISQDDYQIVERNWNVISKSIASYDPIEQDEYYESDEDDDFDFNDDEDPDYDDDDFYSSIAQLYPSDQKNGQSQKEDRFQAIKEFQTYSQKFIGGTKDIGLLYKKYDAKNASKWKLMAKYKSTDFMADEGLSFTKSFDMDNYFRFGTNGATVVIDNEWNTDSDLMSDSWEIYYNTSGDGYECVFHTKKGGIIHLLILEDRAYLENDKFQLEGTGFYSAG